ncbi:GPW/gp25 family protein [Sphingopyxis yananensis]|uniref:GPW/gp25 family protein n=1 Tax=Sphingopyxis yananensis TaxID=2886687 RepID=UPI001D0FA095|nr:GPW/gp25 family protein [Sphingopyxis yananensis]
MNRYTGAPLDGLAHIEQSVADILSTAIGSHVGLRDYGSLLPDRIDHPFSAAGVLHLYAATAVALGRWEKRLRLRRVQLNAGDRPSAAVLIIDADRTDTAASNSRIRLTVPVPL